MTSEILLNGGVVPGVEWDGTTGKFTVPDRALDGTEWTPGQKVHLQVVVDGMASEPVVLVVQPKPAKGTR